MNAAPMTKSASYGNITIKKKSDGSTPPGQMTISHHLKKSGEAQMPQGVASYTKKSPGFLGEQFHTNNVDYHGVHVHTTGGITYKQNKSHGWKTHKTAVPGCADTVNPSGKGEWLSTTQMSINHKSQPHKIFS